MTHHIIAATVLADGARTAGMVVGRFLVLGLIVAGIVLLVVKVSRRGKAKSAERYQREYGQGHYPPGQYQPGQHGQFPEQHQGQPGRPWDQYPPR